MGPTTSCSEPHDVVQDVPDQEPPPDDKSQDRRQGRAGLGGFSRKRLASTYPVSRQQCQPNGDEMLLDVEQAKDFPMPAPFQMGPDIDAERQVDDGAEQRRGAVENDDS